MNPFPSRQLLKWFAANQRSLPWRKHYQPYEVLVSEVMLQQTRVEQMLPYYRRFLQQFPSLEALADAEEQVVLKAWEGLGYYSRARNLHQTAREIREKHRGEIPAGYKELAQLPGIGPYIAAAVSSIAFHQPRAVLDGNVQRVLARFFGKEGDISKSSIKKEFQGLVDQLLPPDKSRDFNQALMELGALVCVPKQPLCGQCPLREGCYAQEHHKQAELPVKSKRAAQPTRVFAALWAEKGERVWMVQRKQRLLQGLWELPQVAFNPLEDDRETLRRKFGKVFGHAPLLGEEMGQAEHTYTHFHQKVVLFRAKNVSGENRDWVGKAQLKQLPISKVNQKLLNLAEQVR